jgi:hypothetical protein
VSEFTAVVYEDVKKNHPYNPGARFANKNTPKLFSMDAVAQQSVSTEESVRRAEERANAALVAARSPAPSAGAPAPSNSGPPQPISRGRQLRTARVNKTTGEIKPEAPAPAPELAPAEPSPATSEPAAGAETVITPATTAGE